MKNFELQINSQIRNVLNRTLTRAAKKQRELIQKDYTLSSKRIRNLTKLKRASVNNLSAEIRTSKTKLSLNNFKRVQNKEGVRVHIAKGKSLFFKGAFLGIRQGGSKLKTTKSGRVKRDNTSGFMATRYANTQTHGFELSESYIKSYSSTLAPRSDKVYYFKTKDFSLIAKDKTERLQKETIKIFEQELAKE